LQIGGLIGSMMTPAIRGSSCDATVTLATLAAVATAPAEARGVRVRTGVAAVTAATAAAIAADAYFNGGYGYYYGVAPVVYGAQVYVGGYRGWRNY
jgi:hypothetical protein